MTIEPAASGSGPPEDPLTVLVVEDESLVRELVTELLTSAGYRVVTAADAAEAESSRFLAKPFTGAQLRDALLDAIALRPSS